MVRVAVRYVRYVATMLANVGFAAGKLAGN
jgi:hypothetical protein